MDFFTLYNLEYGEGRSFVKTQQVNREIQRLTSFAVKDVANDLYHTKLRWVLTIPQNSLVDFFTLYNPEHGKEGSFVKTQRDIAKIQKLTSFAGENVVTSCFVQNSDGFSRFLSTLR